MKVITGNQFNTNMGNIIVPDEQEAIFKIGEKVQFRNKEYTIMQIIPPSIPEAKWSIRVA